ncbi:MAG: Fe-S cluster assembly protein SufD [Bacteroidales bacterium]|jgi:Fe-S cluster assembly protein SufD|nr:Fe-S cluster assembly protein SufD [Bacteroidales bacterium]
MKDLKYIFKDDGGFRCGVPLMDSRQVVITDGVINRMDATGDYIIKNPDGAFSLSLQDGRRPSGSIQIVKVLDNPGSSAKSDNYITVGKESSSRMLLCYHTMSEAAYSSVEKVHVSIQENASVVLTVMQNQNSRSDCEFGLVADLAQGASLKLNLITLSGGETRNRPSINFTGEHAGCEVNGLYLADGSQKIDTVVNINHMVPYCKSSQLFRGILNGKAVTKFNGVIYVAKDAQKTEAFQANNNLLSSEQARAYTQPHLIIYADDVKCSHGATVGNLNEDELFYLRSRGISLEEARQLQQQAFAYGVLSKIDNVELRRELEIMTAKRLRGELTGCMACVKG